MPTNPNTEVPSTGRGGEEDQEPPALAAKGPPKEPLGQNGGLWGGVIFVTVIIAIAIAVVIIRRKSRKRTRHRAPAGREMRPLVSSSTPGEF